jgi:hypothetical protein
MKWTTLRLEVAPTQLCLETLVIPAHPLLLFGFWRASIDIKNGVMLASFLSAYVLIDEIPKLFECTRKKCEAEMIESEGDSLVVLPGLKGLRLARDVSYFWKGHDAVKYANEHSRDTRR